MNHTNESSLYNSADTAIRINSENDQSPDLQMETRINDESSSPQHTVNIDTNATTSSDSSTVHQNFLSFLHGARNHLGGGRHISLQTIANNDNINNNQNPPEDSNVNRWRVNLNNVLSFSAGPSPDTIRSWIPRRGTFRYVPSRNPPGSDGHNDSGTSSTETTATNDVVINFGSTAGSVERSESSSSTGRETRPANTPRIALSRTNSGGVPVPPSSGDDDGATGGIGTEPGGSPIGQQNSSTTGPRTPTTPPPRNASELDEDNVVYELAVKILSHFVRYLPFIGIVLLKSIYDHWLGIVDILVLHTVVYQVNKSVCEQVAKLSQKNIGILIRDYLLVTFVIVYRFIIAHSRPDYLGLLVNTATDFHSFGQLLHAVAVNDLILKLITIKIKILITALPVDVIKHKPRGRLFALIEAISQMYRSLVPIKMWLIYLNIYYTGVDVIVGLFLFSLLYMGAKAFEFIDRGKFLKKALCSFLRNVDYGRQPSKEELSDAGTLCPICHDSYDTPVVLECKHIFCEVCVGTWFKREQTCPMCRAKVADDPTWQNGSTTLFYQLY